MKLCSQFYKKSRAAILRYHSISDPENNFYASPSICIPPAVFEEQVRYISKNYNVVSLDTVEDCIKNKIKFKPNSVVFTFDDGYQDNFRAYKILKKYDCTGTFYIAAGCMENKETLWLFEVIYLINQTTKKQINIKTDKSEFSFPLSTEQRKQYAIRKVTEIIKSNNLKIREEIRFQLREQLPDVYDLDKKASKIMLTWNQVKEMSDNGMTIGGHTMTHLNLPNADFRDAEDEVIECKRLIEEKTGKKAKHFSYPNGGNYDYYNPKVVELVKKTGFSTATTSNNGVVDLGSDLYELNRIRVTAYLSEILYQKDMEPLIHKIF